MTDNKTIEFLIKNLTEQANIRDDTFLNSIAYYLITGRKGINVYQGYGSFAAVCRHPAKNNTLLIFPEIGKNDGKLTAFILSRIDCSKFNVILARYTNHEINNLSSAIQQIPDTELTFSAVNDDGMDWEYPLHILDTGKVSDMDGPDFRNIRQKFRQSEKCNISTIGIHDKNGLTYAEAAHKYWLGNQIVINIHKHKDNVDDFYDCMFSLIKKYPERFDGVVFFISGKPVAFSVWDTPVNNTVNLIANLADTSIKGLSEYQTVTVCRHLYKKNILYLNWGGSERPGLHLFKEKFSPCRSLKKLSYSVIPMQHTDNTIKEFHLTESNVLFRPSDCSFSPFSSLNGF